MYSHLAGHFNWDGQNFTQSARNITFSVEGPDAQPLLHAELQNRAGDYVPNDINLAEHIGNENGQLVFHW
jgi:hypothetical protein